VTHRILIADDEPHIRDVIAFALERAGMEVALARTGTEALRRAKQGDCALAVLDIGLPEMDGLEVCRQLRRSSDLPILFLTARSDEIDRVLGLEIGGDDYVTKPFSPRELVARVSAILRRGRAAPVAEMLRHGGLLLDPAARTLRHDGHLVDLTALEFAIVEALLKRPGHVLTRDMLIDAAYGPNMHVAERTVDSHVRNIRAKLRLVGGGDVIETVHSVGFKLAEVT
jgi:two-component system OmpR family response regulator